MTAPAGVLNAQRVDDLIKECVFTDEEAKALGMDEGRVSAEELVRGLEESGEALLAECIMRHYAFHPGRLEAHREDVREMLAELPLDFQPPPEGGGGTSFLNLCMTRDGHQWTGLHLTMEALCAMAIALDEGFWTLPRMVWPALYGGMPYFTVGKRPEGLDQLADTLAEASQARADAQDSPTRQG